MCGAAGAPRGTAVQSVGGVSGSDSVEGGSCAVAPGPPLRCCVATSNSRRSSAAVFVTQKVNNRQELYAKIGQELTTNFFCLSNVTIASIMFLKKGRNQSLKTGVVKDLMFKDNKKCNVRYHHTFFALILFSVYAHK